MPTLAPERSVEEIVAGWRRGLDEDGWDNPAGPRFIGDYAEFEITMTGNQTKDPYTMGSVCTAGWCTFCC
jgi:hypothetical protein